MKITYFINDTTILTVFRVNPQTGELILVSSLDYESPNKAYSLFVYATDNSTMSSTVRIGYANVTINIIDVNDNTPQFIGMQQILYTSLI